ncbi:hypothetical protein WG66_006483 [Moniliophthora roreri]|nr:hypothetical protein WG66_006483 [Moniliophthora roreri]
MTSLFHRSRPVRRSTHAVKLNARPSFPPSSDWSLWEAVLEAVINDGLQLGNKLGITEEGKQSAKRRRLRVRKIKSNNYVINPPTVQLYEEFCYTFHRSASVTTMRPSYPTATAARWLHLFSDKTIITMGQSVRFRAKSTHHGPSRIALVHLFASSSSDLLQMTPLLVTVVPLVKGQANEIV